MPSPVINKKKLAAHNCRQRSMVLAKSHRKRDANKAHALSDSVGLALLFCCAWCVHLSCSCSCCCQSAQHTGPNQMREIIIGILSDINVHTIVWVCLCLWVHLSKTAFVTFKSSIKEQHLNNIFTHFNVVRTVVVSILIVSSFLLSRCVSNRMM